MLTNQKNTHQINVLKKFIQEENKKNGRLDEQAYEVYKGIISKLRDEETIIVPLYAPRYILLVSFTSLIVKDLLEIQASQDMDYAKLSIFKDKDGDVQIMSSCYTFCISEDDVNKMIAADINSPVFKKVS